MKKRKKTRSRPWKRSRKNDNSQEKKKENTLSTKKKRRKLSLFFLDLFLGPERVFFFFYFLFPEIEIHTLTQSRFQAGRSRFQAVRSRFPAGRKIINIKRSNSGSYTSRQGEGRGWMQSDRRCPRIKMLFPSRRLSCRCLSENFFTYILEIYSACWFHFINKQNILFSFSRRLN